MKSSIARGARFAVARGSVALCILSLALGEQRARAQGATPPATAAPDPRMAEARRHFELGLNLLRDPEGEIVEAAYLEFKTAYDLSKSPRILGNIGYCAMKIERNSEAVAAYREYERLVPNIDPAERAQIDQDLVTMTDGAATVTVRYAGPTAWTLVDERVPVRAAMVTNTYGPTSQPLTLLLHPGHHVLRLKAGGDEQGRWEIDATGGASVAHTFEPKPAAPLVVAPPKPEAERPPPPSRAPQMITMAAGGALVVGGAVTGIAAFLKMKSIERECPGNACRDASSRSDVSTARTLGTATDVLLIGGGALVVGGAAWFALSGSRRQGDSPAPPSVAGACVPGACGLSVRGSF